MSEKWVGKVDVHMVSTGCTVTHLHMVEIGTKTKKKLS